MARMRSGWPRWTGEQVESTRPGEADMRNRAGVTARERGFRADAETQLGPLENRDGRLCARFLGPL